MFSDVLDVGGGSRDIQKALQATTQTATPQRTQIPLQQSRKVNHGGEIQRESKRRSWLLDGAAIRRWKSDEAKSSGSQSVSLSRLETPKCRYSSEEYDRLIAPLKSSEDWTKKETDYLIDLVYRHNVAWPVIVDKYTWPPVVKRIKTKGKTNSDMIDDHPSSETETDDGDGDGDGDMVPLKRDIVDLKNRFYSVCHAIAQQQTNAILDDPNNQRRANLNKYIFDPRGEALRRKQAEARFEVNSFVADKEEKLRNILSVLQELSKKIEGDASMENGTREVPSDFNEILNTMKHESGAYAESELSRLERDLLPLRNVIDGVYRTKGVALASQLMKQNSDIFSSCVHQHQKKSAHGGGGASTISSRGANTPAGAHGVGDLHNAKEVSEGIEKVLRNVVREASIDHHDLRDYFAHRFTPTISTRQTLEAYTDLRLDAAVCFQLQKELEQLDAMHDKWVVKLLEVRKNLRTARRAVTKVPPQTKPTLTATKDPLKWRPSYRPPTAGR